MLAWYDVVMSVVKQEWLDDQRRRASLPVRTLADVHPLYRFLTEGTDPALIQVSELGQYIEAFRLDPAISGVIKDLVSAKFPSTVFELAMALNALEDDKGCTRVSRDANDYQLELERQTSPDRTDPIALSSLGTELDCRDAPNWDVQFDQITEAEPRRLQLRILVRFPTEVVSSAKRILKKLDKEAKQLRGVQGPRVVLLDISWR